MDEITKHAEMWADLWNDRHTADAAQHRLTNRARLYIEAGLPVEKVLDALGCSRATWYRRLTEMQAWRDRNTAAAKELRTERRAQTDDDDTPPYEPPTVTDLGPVTEVADRYRRAVGAVPADADEG